MALLKINRSLLETNGWVLAGLGTLGLLGVMKAIQRGFESGFALESFIWNVLLGRITNVSLWMLVFGLIWIVVMATIIRCFDRHLAIGEEIAFAKRDIWRFVILVLFQWFAYMQAVYRDGGTFFFATGDDSIDAKAVGKLGEVQAIQTVEGIILLIALSVGMGWCCIGFRLLRYMPTRLIVDHRETPAAECAAKIVRWSFIPPILLLIVTIVAVTMKWKQPINLITGIKSAFFAQLTLVVMCGAYTWLAYRAWLQSMAVLEWTFSPPFVKMASRLEGFPMAPGVQPLDSNREGSGKMDPLTIISAIAGSLKLVDQFRDMVLKYRDGKAPPPPSGVAKEIDHKIVVQHNGQELNTVKPSDLNMGEWDTMRYKSLHKKITANWTIFCSIESELPKKSGKQKAQDQVELDDLKVELCQDFREMVRLSEKTLGVSLPDHYSLYEVCGPL